MKRLSIFFVIAFDVCLSTSFCGADEYLTSKSPNGKFALHVSRGDKQPFPQSCEIVNSKTWKVILALDKDKAFDPEAKLFWSNDSQWAAYCTLTKEYEDDVATRVFLRNGDAFDEIKMPKLSPPKIPDGASPADEQHRRIIPVSWTKPGLLELEYEILSDSWGRTAEQISIQFDKDHQASIVKSEPERPSIIEYYLLLPKDTFETRPRDWLHNAKVDKENGYMDVSGDGAQPSFQVALFRYRDGRPLLAVCQGELEGDDSLILQFFEMGADGKMHKAPRSIFPIGDALVLTKDEQLEYEGWQFQLPRHGRTIVVHKLKNHKVLHKFTWNGEAFVEEQR
jgi:hypothetical protein